MNADHACENPTATVPGAEFSDVRGIGFENSYANLGGRCTYRMDDGTVVVTREPGWWFSGAIVGFVALLAALAVLSAGRKGHRGVLFGLVTLVAPPLGVALVLAAGRNRRQTS